MTVDSRTRYLTFSLWLLAILVGLTVLTALSGVGVRAWAPGFDLQTMQAIASHRDATLTTIAGIVTDAGSFALLAPLSIAFLLLRRWKRPFDDIALLVIAAGSAVLRDRPLSRVVPRLSRRPLPHGRDRRASPRVGLGIAGLPLGTAEAREQQVGDDRKQPCHN